MDDVKMEVILGDILSDDSDVIVITVNALLNGVTGDLNIEARRRGGYKLVEAVERKQKELEIDILTSGNVILTEAGDLPARYVVHAVGPIWRGGEENEWRKLRSCHAKAIEEAEKVEAVSIAFCAISQGGRGYPPELAVRDAVGSVLEALGSAKHIRRVRFYAPNTGVLGLYKKELPCPSSQ